MKTAWGCNMNKKSEWDWKDFKWGGVDEDWSSDGD